jgi:uncharacterized membrane protein required for colicin V production
MSIILDLAVVAVIIINVILSAKKGFVKTVVEVVGFIIALSLAFSLSTPVAEYTYDSFVGPAVEKSLTESTQNIADTSPNDLFETLPPIITENAKNFGISTESILGEISGSVKENSTEAVQTISQDIVRPITVKIISMVATLLIFLVLSIVVKFLAKVLNKLFSFSIIGKINTNLGGVIGFFKGIVFATVLCVAISLVINLTGSGFWVFTPDNINATYLFKFFTSFSQFII